MLCISEMSFYEQLSTHIIKLFFCMCALVWFKFALLFLLPFSFFCGLSFSFISHLKDFSFHFSFLAFPFLLTVRIALFRHRFVSGYSILTFSSVQFSFQALNSGGLMPAGGATAILPATAVMPAAASVKRPALVDTKTGLPVYQPGLTAAAGTTLPYQQLGAAQLPLGARYISLPGILLHVYC